MQPVLLCSCKLHAGLLQVCSAQQTIAQQVQTAVAGVSTNINIPCSLRREDEAPFWYINGTSYELFSIPQFFPYIPVVDSYTHLTIPMIYPELNDTLFRCAHIDNRGIVVLGVPQRLRVASKYIKHRTTLDPPPPFESKQAYSGTSDQ